MIKLELEYFLQVFMCTKINVTDHKNMFSTLGIFQKMCRYLYLFKSLALLNIYLVLLWYEYI